jgi:hypothetical protein
MKTNEPVCLAGLQEAMARAPRWVDTSEAILHRRRVICQQGDNGVRPHSTVLSTYIRALIAGATERC